MNGTVQFKAGPMGTTLVLDTRHPGWTGHVSGNSSAQLGAEVYRHGCQVWRRAFPPGTTRTSAAQATAEAMHYEAATQDRRTALLKKYPTPCPHCGVDRGTPCRTSTGNTLSAAHSARQQAAAAAMADLREKLTGSRA